MNTTSRLTFNQNGDLIIKHATMMDSGDYKCEWNTRFGIKQRQNIKVFIIRKPRIISKAKHVLFKSGSNASFDCDVKVPIFIRQ